MPSIPLPYASYALDSLPASCSRLVNCYIEQLPPDAKTPARLVRAPGIAVMDEATGPIDGMISTQGRLYVHTTLGVLIEWTGFGTLGSSAGAAKGPGLVDLAANTDNVVAVVEGGPVAEAASYFTITPPITSNFISDADFLSRGASQVEFLDNYVLFLEPRTGRFFGADLGSVTAFDALNYATAESQPDDNVGFIADHGQLIIFGGESGEIWQNAGIQGFPFTRLDGGRIQLGCAAGRSLASVDQTVFWLANDGTVRALNGVTPGRVSTHAIEKLITGDVSGARAYSQSFEGHEQYVLHLPNNTVVYDAATQTWHERKTYGENTWLPSFHTRAFGKTLVANPGSVEIGYFDRDTFTEFGEPQVMSWTYQPVYAENRMASHLRLEVGLETGVGTTSVTDPKIMLEYSDDGGNTFTHFSTQSLGAKGRRETRVMWHGLGMSNNRVYRMSVSDPVTLSVTDTSLDAVGARL
jgi:hypothetical protein